MTTFSAYHISSQGLKYALNFKAVESDEVTEEKYNKAVSNVLLAQEFDSIPLVSAFDGEITKIARRRLHDGDVEEVILLEMDEVSTLPHDASVIRCMFEVLSNEHHIVFLTEGGEIKHVVTISMLAQPIVAEYLTLLLGKLINSGWHFHEEHLGTRFEPTYHFPQDIHAKLVKLAKLVDDPLDVPTDREFSQTIVDVLNSLQPLKPWGEGLDELLSVDFPLAVPSPDYLVGTAGYFAQHPFGAVMDDEHQGLAFRLFSEANNWDRLLLQPPAKEPYTHVLERKTQSDAIERTKLQPPLDDDSPMEAILGEFDDQFRPLLVHFKNSKYPGIITLQDVVFSEFTKRRLLNEFLGLEIWTRNQVMFYLGRVQQPRRPKRYMVQGKNDKFAYPVWTAGIKSVYKKFLKLSDDQKPLFNKKEFGSIMKLRNQLAHHDFIVTPEDEIDPQKTKRFFEYMMSKRDLVSQLTKKSNESVDYVGFLVRLENQYEASFGNVHDFRREMLNVNYEPEDGCFHLAFRDESVAKNAEVVGEYLVSRVPSWKNVVSSEKEQIRRLPEKNVVHKAFKKNIHDKASQLAQKSEWIGVKGLRELMKFVLERVRNELNITNQILIEQYSFTKSSLKSKTGGPKLLLKLKLDVKHRGSGPTKEWSLKSLIEATQ